MATKGKNETTTESTSHQKAKGTTDTNGNGTTSSGVATSSGVTTGSGNRPVKSFKARGVKVSVFANASEKDGKPPSTYYKTSVQRFYKDGDDWKTTASLGRDDIPIVRHLLGKAFDWILETEANQSKDVE